MLMLVNKINRSTLEILVNINDIFLSACGTSGHNICREND